MLKKFTIASFLIALLTFLIPIEHKYDKLFRFYSLTLIPKELFVSSGYEKKLYFYISDLIALILMSIALFWIKIPLKNFFKSPLWIVFFCALLSIALSEFKSYPVAYSKLLQLLTPIVLFSFISNAFADEKRGKITQIILTVIVAAGLFQSFVAIIQYFHQEPMGLRLLGETNEKAILIMQSKSRWLIDQILGTSAKSSELMRAAGTLPHANLLGGFLVFSILASYTLLMYHKKKNWLLALSLPVQLFAMLLSFSRSALFAWALATLSWFFLMAFQKEFQKQRLVWIATIVVISFSTSLSVLYQQYVNRGGVISSTSLSKSSNAIRKIHQKASLSIIREKPFFGLGFSQFSEKSSKYLTQINDPFTKSSAPHNIFLFLACETGLISAFSLIIFLIILAIQALSTPINLEKTTFFSLFIAYNFIGLCDFYPILFQQGKLLFFLNASLLSIHSKVYNSSKDMLQKSSI